jgi:hypothetical protein
MSVSRQVLLAANRPGGLQRLVLQRDEELVHLRHVSLGRFPRVPGVYQFGQPFPVVHIHVRLERLKQDLLFAPVCILDTQNRR